MDSKQIYHFVPFVNEQSSEGILLMVLIRVYIKQIKISDYIILYELTCEAFGAFVLCKLHKRFVTRPELLEIPDAVVLIQILTEVSVIFPILLSFFHF